MESVPAEGLPSERGMLNGRILLTRGALLNDGVSSSEGTSLQQRFFRRFNQPQLHAKRIGGWFVTQELLEYEHFILRRALFENRVSESVTLRLIHRIFSKGVVKHVVGVGVRPMVTV